MANVALLLGCAMLGFGPLVSLFITIVYPKAQLVIVVTTAAFFFLLGAVCASAVWSAFAAVGLSGPFASIIPGVFFQFIFRCIFVALYHKVERVIQITLHRQHEEERASATDQAVRPTRRNPQEWAEAAKLRLQLNDALCGVAAGVGYGGMHAIMLYGTLLANQTTNNVGILYQDSCPSIPSLVVSAIFAFLFSILDIFWMLFTFFGMRRRLMYHRGQQNPYESSPVSGGWLGNSRTGGNLALLYSLLSHFLAATITTLDFFKYGCSGSLSALGVLVLLTSYFFWAGCGRIFMPPAHAITVTNSMSRVDSED